MGLLDSPQDDWLALRRNALQNDGLNADQDAGAARNALPSWLSGAWDQQLAPLSLAGPSFPARSAATSPASQDGVPQPRSRPAAADEALWSGRRSDDPLPLVPQADQPASLPRWAQTPAGNPFTAPGLTAQNLTAHTLRMKGVPEADIAAALDDPRRMQQLITEVYRPAAGGRPERHPAPSGTPGDTRLAVDSKDSPSWGDIGSDAWRSGLSGLGQSGIELAGAVGDARTLASAATDYVGNKLGFGRSSIDRFKDVASRQPGMANVIQAPTSRQVRSAVESVMGPLYEPKTGTGRVLHTIGEYGSALVDPELLLQKGFAKLAPKLTETLASRVIAPALGSEAAGYLAKDTSLEPVARMAGAALSGGGTAGLARQIERGEISNALSKLNNRLVQQPPLQALPTLNLSHPLFAGLLGGMRAGSDEYKRQRHALEWKAEDGGN